MLQAGRLTRSITTRRGFLRVAGLAAGGSLLAACAPTPAPTPQPTAAGAPTAPAVAATSGAQQAAPGRTAQPIRAMIEVNNQPPPPREQYDWWLELEKRIGVARLDFDLVPQNSYDEKLSVVLASGDLPDLLWVPDWRPVAAQAAAQGAFMPWDEVLGKDHKVKDPAKYPGLAQHPARSWRNAAYNGRILAVPRPRPAAGEALWIREDWRKKLGRDVPKTKADVDAMWKDFVEKDPDGNGQADTSGFIMSKPTGAVTSSWGLDFFLQAYAVPFGYSEQTDGTLVPALLSPGFREAIVWAHEAYAAGVIDKEFVAINNSQRDQKFAASKGGSYYHPTSGYVSRYRNVVKATPEALVYAISPVSAPGATAHSYNNPGWSGLVAISAKSARDAGRREELIHVLDFFADKKNDTFLNYGVEGVHYQLNKEGFPEPKDGKEINSNLPNSLGNWAYPVRTQPGPSGPFSAVQINEFVADLSQRLESIGIDDPSWGLVSQTYLQRGRALDDFYNTSLANFITGKTPISDWEKFVAEWRSRGGDAVATELTKLNQERKRGA